MATGIVPNVDTPIALAGKNYIADRWYCRGNDMGVFFINTEPIPFFGFKKTSGTVLSSCSTVWPTWLQTTLLPFLLTSMSSNRNFWPNLYWLTSLPSLIFHTLRFGSPAGKSWKMWCCGCRQWSQRLPSFWVLYPASVVHFSRPASQILWSGGNLCRKYNKPKGLLRAFELCWVSNLGSSWVSALLYRRKCAKRKFRWCHWQSQWQ